MRALRLRAHAYSRPLLLSATRYVRACADHDRYIRALRRPRTPGARARNRLCASPGLYAATAARCDELSSTARADPLRATKA